MSIYISTGAYKTKDIYEILKTSKEASIRNIEISPGLGYCKDIKEILLANRNEFSFLIHNYFPTPKKHFALNLASNNTDTINKSMDMCYEAIEFVADMGLTHYSVHCGFCFETAGKELGNRGQINLPRIPYNLAKRKFTENIRKLAVYAKKRGVRIAIENNVMADYASGQKELYLGVDTYDLKELLEMIDMPNVGILLDLAHAQVSDTYLSFGIENMIEELKDDIIEIHVSDNNGKIDENKMISKNSKMLHYLKMFSGKPIAIEVYNLDMQEINEQITLVEKTVYCNKRN